MSVNKVILVGHLGKDPETRYMTSGEAVTSVTLATTEKWKDKSGEKQEKTEWHNLTFFRRLAEVAGEYLKKGSLIYVEGKLTTEKWADKNGQDRYTTKIICDELQMLGGKPDEQGTAKPVAQAVRQPAANQPSTTGGAFANFDDDIPF